MDDNDGEGFTDLNGEDCGGIERFPNGGTSAFGRVCLPFNQILLVLHSNCSLIAINDTHACFQKQEKLLSRLHDGHCLMVVVVGKVSTCATTPSAG